MFAQLISEDDQQSKYRMLKHAQQRHKGALTKAAVLALAEGHRYKSNTSSKVQQHYFFFGIRYLRE